MSGTLKDVGTGLITPHRFRKIIEERDRTSAGITAPSKGLTLMKIYY